MADSVALSVQLAGAEAALAQLTQLDSVVKSLKANRNVNISVNSRSLSTAADRAAQLNTNLQESSNTAKQMGTTGARNINQAGQALDKASRNAESFRMGMGSVVLNMAKFRLASSAINLVAGAFKDALGEMKNVDTELVNIRKVTGFTNEEIEKLSKNAYALASQYGRSASEVLEASTVFARAGYTDQIDQLSELSLLLQNVGDLQADDASKFVIATDKAYKLGGSYESLMAVIDGLDNITNKNATDMQKMTEGMTVAGSVFAESGESIEMFAALLGTATANTQRSGSEVARGLRTILMNLRQIRGETEDGELIDGESIAAASKALKDYANISTMENGQLRKASDVLTELAGKWDTLTETQRAAISEAVAGKRQANILMSLMGDWESVQKMMMEYEEAAGTAASENALYMDSWQAKVEQVKASWTQLVAAVVDSDLVKGGLDIANEFLQSVVDPDYTKKKYEKILDEANAAAQETKDLFEADYGEGGRYEYLQKRIASLTAEERTELAVLEAKKAARQAEYEEALRLLGLDFTPKTYDDAQTELNNLARSIGEINYAFQNNLDSEDYRKRVGDLVTEYADYYQSLVETEKAGNDLSNAEKQWKQSFELMSGALVNGSNDVEAFGQTMAAEMLASGKSLKDAEQAGNEAMEGLAEAFDLVPDEKVINITVAGYDEAVAQLSSIGQAATSSFAGFAGRVIGGIPQFAGGTGSAPGGPSLVNERGPEMISANGLAFIAGGGRPSIVNLPRGATVLTAEDTKRLTSGNFGGAIPAYADGTYRKLNLQGNTDTNVDEGPVIVNMPRGAKVLLNGEELIGPAFLNRDGAGGGGGGAGGGGSQVKSFKDLEEELNDRLKNLDAQAKLAENEEDFLKAMQIYGEAQDYIAELLDKYRAAGYAEDSDEVLRLANLGYDYAAKQLGGYDKLQEQLIDALNALTKATEDANELAERQEAVEKAREALANAERQRTVRIFNPVTGQWEWVANAGDVARAQENLKNAEESLRKEELSQAISAIQNADAESLGNMTLSPAILEALFNGSADQQSAFLNALGAATGGANWLSSSAAQTAWNQGNSIGTQYNLNGINLTPEQASGMTIMQLITMLQGLKIM